MNSSNKSRYYFREDVVPDPAVHAQTLRSLLLMAEYSAINMVENREYFGDRREDFLHSLHKILNLITGKHE